MSFANRVSGVKPIQFLAHQVVTVALDLLFPVHCVGCERVGSFLCDRCMQTVSPAPPRHIGGLDAVRAAVNFDGAASRAVHAFKYEGQVDLAACLGTWVCETLADIPWHVDCVTAVPLHPLRMEQRGYNQAALIAQVVAAHFDWEYCHDAVSRTRETPSQVNLNAQERKVNVAGAFAAQADDVTGRRVLLIDDVLTTGATLGACAYALRDAGAVQVYGATVASAVFSV